MNTKTINQTILIKNASPHEIYEIFMDSRKHAKLVDSSAVISRNIGGKFKIYDGYISGKNIELDQDKKIVQYWRGNEDEWPKEHYSKLSIILDKDDRGTKITLVQEEVPDKYYDDFYKGWYDFYWTPLQKMFEQADKTV
ncbi:MAG: SRPBCC domain-containing protein [Actinobacteria bacterium]|nr:SRPBCC domain-containing protein [Actinomycetota bacterium]